jgi:hypothetical protein
LSFAAFSFVVSIHSIHSIHSLLSYSLQFCLLPFVIVCSEPFLTLRLLCFVSVLFFSGWFDLCLLLLVCFSGRLLYCSANLIGRTEGHQNFILVDRRFCDTELVFPECDLWAQLHGRGCRGEDWTTDCHLPISARRDVLVRIREKRS